MLNRVWPAFFLLAFASCLWQAILGHPEVLAAAVEASFKTAKSAVEIALGLTGVLCFWLGLFQIAEKSGLTDRLAWVLAPLFRRLMPDVPAGHPAIGSVTMNMAANMLGLDNAATPMGLKAMKDLQSLNPDPETATNAQVLFLVLNTSSVTLIPVSVFVYRAQMGAPDPASVFLPILMATSVGTLTGLLAVAWVQKLKLWDRVVFAYLAAFLALMAGCIKTDPLKIINLSSVGGGIQADGPEWLGDQAGDDRGARVGLRRAAQQQHGAHGRTVDGGAAGGAAQAAHADKALGGQVGDG